MAFDTPPPQNFQSPSMGIEGAGGVGGWLFLEPHDNNCSISSRVG